DRWPAQIADAAWTVGVQGQSSKQQTCFSLLLGQDFWRALVWSASRSLMPSRGEWTVLSSLLIPSAPCPGSARRRETYTSGAPPVNTQLFVPFAKSRSFVGG